MAKILVMPHYNFKDVVKGKAAILKYQGDWKAVADKRREELRTA